LGGLPTFRNKPHPSPRRQFLRDHHEEDGGNCLVIDDFPDNTQSSILERPSRTPSPTAHRRKRLAAEAQQQHQWSNSLTVTQPTRRGGGRRLPATPNKPSTLNIDNLAANTTVIENKGATLGGNLFNFPKLEPSPTKMKNFLQGIRKGARLPEVFIPAAPVAGPHRNTVGRWSRSLDDPVTFEEAVIAGRGTRQLPTVGPQQLMQSNGRGRGAVAPRRELPRPGTTIGFSATTNNASYPGDNGITLRPTYSESEDEEDWC
jgi:hypothetical protein